MMQKIAAITKDGIEVTHGLITDDGFKVFLTSIYGRFKLL